MAIQNTYKPIVPMFLQWYYLEAPCAIVLGAVAYVVALAEIFPFGFLLMTLLSPWKNIVDRTVMHGIDLNLMAEKLSLGLLARLVGFVIRVLTIVFGLIVEIIMISGSTLLLAVWLTFPILFVLGFITCIRLL